jgi:hypothetical protein
MFARIRPRRLAVLGLLAALLLLSLTAARSFAQPVDAHDPIITVTDVDLIDVVLFPTGYEFAGTEVGGLSSMIYDASRGVYYVLSDDRSEINPSRFYTVDISVTSQELEVNFLGVTFLTDRQGNLFDPFEIDPEGLELARPGYLIVSTEGDDDTTPLTDPFVERFNLVGRQNQSYPVPDKFLYSVPGNHVRDNLGFESLTVTPNGRYLYAAAENALLLDGPISTLTNGSPSRVIEFDQNRRRALAEYLYCVEPIPNAPNPPGAFADNGLVELQALDNRGTFLAMERSFAVGFGNTIVLYEITTRGAADISETPVLGLAGCPPPGSGQMDKRLVADFELDLGVDPDNVEGLALGPRLPNGRYLLIAVSDNNFSGGQITQFIALSVALEEVSD